MKDSNKENSFNDYLSCNFKDLQTEEFSLEDDEEYIQSNEELESKFFLNRKKNYENSKNYNASIKEEVNNLLYKDVIDNQNTYVGIDLGGSACTVSYYKNERLYTVMNRDTSIFPMAQRLKTFPTCLAFDPENRLLVGSSAYNQRYNPDFTYVDRVKEKLCLNLDYSYNNQQKKIAFLISELFYRLKIQVEEDLGHQVSKVVLTVPANFGESSKWILRDAAKLADLNVLRIVSEPTAAVLYYAQTWKLDKKRNSTCLIIDLGSLTLDMSICHITPTFIKVQSTKGHSSCGMYLVDHAIKEILVRDLELKYPGISERLSKKDHQKLLELAEKTKIESELTNSDFYLLKQEIVLCNKIYSISRNFNKKELWNAYRLYFQEFYEIYCKLMKESGLSSKMIDRVILVGASVSSDIVRTKVREIIGCPLESYFDNVSCVSKGAAYYGYLSESNESKMVLADLLNSSLGLKLDNKYNTKVLKSGCNLPCKNTITCKTEERTGYLLIPILEGESSLASSCKVLGTITVDANSQKQNVVLDIEMKFEDENLEVAVRDHQTKKNRLIKVEYPQRLSFLRLEELKSLASKNRSFTQSYYDKLNSVSQLKSYLKLIIQLKVKQKQELEDIIISTKKALHEYPMDYSRVKKQLISVKTFLEQYNIFSEPKEGSVFYKERTRDD